MNKYERNVIVIEKIASGLIQPVGFKTEWHICQWTLHRHFSVPKDIIIF